MTPYQRGSRDSLRAIADELDAIAEMAQEWVVRWGEAADRARLPGRIAQYRELATQQAFMREAYRKSAALARRRAEALPEDPETTP